MNKWCLMSSSDKNINARTLELIYRSSRDGADSESFWDKCVLKNNIIILIHNNSNHKFGCYLPIGPFKTEELSTTDFKGFIYQIKPKNIVYQHSMHNDSTVYYGLGNLQTLWLGDYGGAINITQNFTKPNSCTSDPECQTFVGLNCKDLVGDTFRDNIYHWNVVELEVFKLK